LTVEIEQAGSWETIEIRSWGNRTIAIIAASFMRLAARVVQPIYRHTFTKSQYSDFL